ncbi:hypothetical protein ACQ4M4_26105 [Leptolyngbya sp. AN02str]|uniref:hypothetical protein n=1 Tax=Leptolyngbya sp. AN02str TaxID=3423363 RepID=UPI003D31F744
MERILEIYTDGSLYELEDGQAIKRFETQGTVDALIEALQFTLATTFVVAPPISPSQMFQNLAAHGGSTQKALSYSQPSKAVSLKPTTTVAAFGPLAMVIPKGFAEE